MKKSLPIVILLLIIILTACNMSQKPAPSPPVTPAAPYSQLDQTATPKSGEQIAVVETNRGTIKFRFFPEIAPETAKNFQELAKKGFYNKLTFHRVIPDFMIQGGDPNGDGTGGQTYKGPGTTLKAEFSAQLKHIRGAVSMARKGNDINSASSQFFIVQNKQGADFLDNQYTVFGQVFEGLDVVDEIANTKRDANDKPLSSVIMEKVTIVERQ